MVGLFVDQLSDPFRIGLLIALFATMLRTRAATGIWLSLAAGIVFVAVLIPATMQAGLRAPLWQMVGIGIVANAVVVAIILAVWTLYQRSR